MEASTNDILADSITITKITNCIDSTVILSADPGYSTYLWSTGDVTQNIEVNQSGAYSLTVTDNVNNTFETSIDVSNGDFENNLTVKINNRDFCVGDTGRLYGEIINELTLVDYQYLWNTGEETQEILVFEEGNYSITVTDENGCSTSDMVFVQFYELLPPVITGTSTICPGENIVLCFPGYLVYNSLNSQFEECINVMKSTTITLMDTNGCTGEIYVPIEIEDSVVVSGIHVLCQNDGSLLLFTPENYAFYHWSTGEFTSQIQITENGNYSVTVTDINGCTGSAEIVINNTEIQVPEIIAIDLCEDSILLELSGNEYNSYLWNNGSERASIYVVDTGTYTVTVTDMNACNATASLYQGYLPMTITYESVSAAEGENNGSGSIMIEGGLPEYLIEWNNPESSTGPIVTGLAAGDYTVTVTDAQGCSEEIVLTIGTSTSIQKNSNNSPFIIFPNPVSDNLIIECSDNGILTGQLQIYDLLGKIQKNTSVSGNGQFRINMDEIPSGLYLLKITYKGKSYLNRFFKLE